LWFVVLAILSAYPAGCAGTIGRAKFLRKFLVEFFVQLCEYVETLADCAALLHGYQNNLQLTLAGSRPGVDVADMRYPLLFER
jgi:hypothetical protein